MGAISVFNGRSSYPTAIYSTSSDEISSPVAGLLASVHRNETLLQIVEEKERTKRYAIDSFERVELDRNFTTRELAYINRDIAFDNNATSIRLARINSDREISVQLARNCGDVAVTALNKDKRGVRGHFNSNGCSSNFFVETW